METPPSTIGRLLAEISWEGNARTYRQGGRGLENVLSAEVFQALDFLPRMPFLGRIIQSIKGGCPKTRGLLADQVEEATISLLPGSIHLRGEPTESASGGTVEVQPDGIIEAPEVYCLLEAKRLRRGSFQPEQLAREYLTVLQETGKCRPLLLLVLPSPPPIPVRGHGRLSLRDAITNWLCSASTGLKSALPAPEDLVESIDSVVAYTTWSEISAVVQAGLEEFATSEPAVRGSVSRLAESVLQAIQWHS